MASQGDRPRRFSDDIPVSGAWREGDHPGNRQFLPLAVDRPMALEFGGSLTDVKLAYETWGTLNDDASNAVLVCHALTGDSHVVGDLGPGHKTDGWWGDLVGPGRAIDTNRFYVVCANVLGGCQGTTGPASDDPTTGKPYGPDFPVVSMRDSVRTQARLADHLGIDRWFTVIGGSMGGMQVLEWAVMFPERVRTICCFASSMAATPWQIAWSAAGRNCLSLDPNWRDGHYYDAAPGDGPHAGLAAARGIAVTTYRSDALYTERFHRDVVDSLDSFGVWGRFQVEGYLDHMGEKLARRFDANSYISLNRAMDLHDIGRGRGGLSKAAGRITAPALIVSVSSDDLYHPHHQVELHDRIRSGGGTSTLHAIESDFGHDGFLLEAGTIGRLVTEFFDNHGSLDG